MRYRIVPQNYQQYAASFYDTDCLECQTIIHEGDPMGFIIENPLKHTGRRFIPQDEKYGPLCDLCLDKLKTPMYLEKQKRLPRPSS